MTFRQIQHPQTGCASCVFGCLGKARLAAVDPHTEQIDDYLAVASQANFPVVAIFETHVQVDHVSGGGDREHADAPRLVFTGETLFVGVGDPA